MNSLQRRAINDTLSNDEVSGDEELVQYFMEEIRLTEAEARNAVSQRNAFLVDPTGTTKVRP